MGRIPLVLAACAALAVLFAQHQSSSAQVPEQIIIEVTNPADALPLSACPDAAKCTLRKAIETANTDTTGIPIEIRFAASTFPNETPVSIVLAATPLPALTRDDVTITAVGRGVVVQGTPTGLNPSVDGVVSTGARTAVRGLSVRGFTGTCVRLIGINSKLGGTTEAFEGNSLEHCAVAARIDGAGATVGGNQIGLAPTEGTTPSITLGLWITASDVAVGPPPLSPNVFGSAETAIKLGGVGTSAIGGLRIEDNVLGGTPEAPGRLATAIDVWSPVAGVSIKANQIRNATAGVAVRGGAGGPNATGADISANTFDSIGGRAIDLNADRDANPNDDGDADSGGNGLANHPVFTRTTITSVTGTACPGCRVEVYLAHHAPGGRADYGTTLLPGGTVTAAANGVFSVDAAGLAAGTWLTATSTDTTGNTSEFSPGARVGAGSLQCSTPALSRGWNLVGYFGAEPLSLGTTFPGASGALIRAAYRYDPYSGTYLGWISGWSGTQGLTTLQPGEPYWILSDGAASLPGSISFPTGVPVPTKAGWNIVTYIGATAPVADALGTVEELTGLVSWDATNQTWASFGDASLPAWAQDFDTVNGCGAYLFSTPVSGTLVPLQP